MTCYRSLQPSLCYYFTQFLILYFDELLLWLFTISKYLIPNMFDHFLLMLNINHFNQFTCCCFHLIVNWYRYRSIWCHTVQDLAATSKKASWYECFEKFWKMNHLFLTIRWWFALMNPHFLHPTLPFILLFQWIFPWNLEKKEGPS